MNRRTFLKGLLATVLAAPFVGLYAFFVEPALRLRVRRWRIARSDWPEQPLRIVAISDIHLGEPIVDMERLQQVVRRANALAPDVTVLLGDYTASHRFVTQAVPFADAAPVLAQLTARLGVYAILGNHDWWEDEAAQARGGGPSQFAGILEAQGIPVLSNSAVDIGPVWLAGLEDQLAIKHPTGGYIGLDDLPATMAQVPDDGKPCILLAHEPDIFVQVPDRVALTLSGHTHGGQVRLFGWSPRVPSRYGNRFAYGPVHEAGRDLVVSGGIGCSILPIRLGVVPEITVIELSQGTPTAA